MLRNLLNDEAGVIISAELVLVLTIAVLSMVVGLSEVAYGVANELSDLSNAIGNIGQNYTFTGMKSSKTVGNGTKSEWKGSTFTDTQDECDCGALVSCSNDPGEATKP